MIHIINTKMRIWISVLNRVLTRQIYSLQRSDFSNIQLDLAKFIRPPASFLHNCSQLFWIILIDGPSKEMLNS